MKNEKNTKKSEILSQKDLHKEFKYKKNVAEKNIFTNGFDLEEEIDEQKNKDLFDVQKKKVEVKENSYNLLISKIEIKSVN